MLRCAPLQVWVADAGVGVVCALNPVAFVAIVNHAENLQLVLQIGRHLHLCARAQTSSRQQSITHRMMVPTDSVGTVSQQSIVSAEHRKGTDDRESALC